MINDIVFQNQSYFIILWKPSFLLPIQAEGCTKFNYSGDEIEMKDQIEKLSKEDVNGYEKLVNFTKKIFDKGFLELADVPFDKPFVMMQQLPALLKLKSYKSVYSLVMIELHLYH